VATARCYFSEYKLLKLQAQIAAYESEIADLRSLLEDPEIRETAEVEIAALLKKKTALEKKLATSDPDDDKNAVVEIQAGTGGDEAALFAGDLYRMYELYCKKAGYRVDCSDFTPGNTGGFKSISFIIEGTSPFEHFKYESGVHRVQRVPETETKGRIHTSTVSVVVIPEQQLEEIEINKDDVKIENFSAGGPGGQSVNTSNCAVRLTHIPTGMSVTSRTKSVQANLKFCWKMLASKLKELQLEQSAAHLADAKRKSRGQAARAEKIRTYNYHHDRVTDHRVEYAKFSLQTIMRGELGELQEVLHQNIE
jgi:peptide chain release factor 1